tara:strand:+ start:593 stop:1270 length:678 start_codon:yes stop_codon:yes gene_type:complete
MAFLGALGKTLGLGSTADVVGGIARRAFGLPGQSAAPAVESASTVSIDNTFETPSSGDEGLYRTVGQGMFTQANPLITRIPQVSDRVRDIITGLGGGEIFRQGLNFFGGDDVICGTQNSMKPYSINKQTGCISVTRKQQNRLKEMVGIVGLEQTASAVGLDTDTLVLLLLKRFKSRGRGITAASMRTTKRTIRQIKSLHNEVSSMAGRKTAVRRGNTTRTSIVKA